MTLLFGNIILHIISYYFTYYIFTYYISQDSKHRHLSQFTIYYMFDITSDKLHKYGKKIWYKPKLKIGNITKTTFYPCINLLITYLFVIKLHHTNIIKNLLKLKIIQQLSVIDKELCTLGK